MNLKTKKKVFWIVIILVMLVVIAIIRIQEEFFSDKPNVEETQTPTEESISIIDNTILFFSDSSIYSDKTLIKSESLKSLFNESDFIYTEKVSEYGMYNSVNPLLGYTDDEIKKSEYIICHGGLLDLAAENEIGDFDDDEYTVIGYIRMHIDYIIEKSPDTKIILVGIPCYNDEEISNYKYSIQDYNAAFKILSNKYDNVYFVDFYEITKDEPLSIQTEEYRYTFNNIKKLYNVIIKELNTLENLEQ